MVSAALAGCPPGIASLFWLAVTAFPDGRLLRLLHLPAPALPSVTPARATRIPGA